jgi:glycosyltransferase involved in cell wall biosynthesis
MMKELRRDAGNSPGLAFLTPGWPPRSVANGIVTFTDRLRRAMRRAGVRVFILAAGEGETVSEPDVVYLPIDPSRATLTGRVLRRVVRRAPEEAHGRAIARAVNELHRRHGVSALEMEESFGWARHVVRHAAVPVIVRLHGPWFLNGACNGVPRDAAFHRRIEQEGLAIESAAGITAPSRSVLEETRSYYGLPLEHALVVPNPIEPVPPGEWWRPEACEPGHVVFIGRFDRHKGGDVLIDAFNMVAKADPRAMLTFVGPDRGLQREDGAPVSLREYMESRLPERARARVRWLDRRPIDELNALRRRAAVTVVPSRYETFGNTAVEALVMGCPLVASAAGGLAEIVRDGETGLQCRPGDAAHLADRILTLLADPALASRLGRAAIDDCATRFDPDLLAGAMLEHHRLTIDRAHRRPALMEA